MQGGDPTLRKGGERPQKNDSKFDPFQTTEGISRGQSSPPRIHRLVSAKPKLLPRLGLPPSGWLRARLIEPGFDVYPHPHLKENLKKGDSRRRG
jgi:hypothetical protein